jgi:aryl-phospho-beta-D-glucosidase BglC (GH1 family)
MFTKGNHMSNNFLPILIMLTLSGCFLTDNKVIKDTITKYESVESQIELGDSKQKVLSILNPTQKGLQSDWKKRPEKYIKKSILVEIFYFRTGLQSDGLNT